MIAKWNDPVCMWCDQRVGTDNLVEHEVQNVKRSFHKFPNCIDFLKDRQKESNNPFVYDSAIKKLRRELLGMYTRLLNGRKVDKPLEVIENVVSLVCASPPLSP